MTADQIARFQEDGYIVVPGLLSTDELDRLRERADWIASGKAPHIEQERLQVEPVVTAGQRSAPTYAESLRKMAHVAFSDELMFAHATNVKILDAIEALLGPDFKLVQDQLFMKPARVGSRQKYHQDAPLGFHIDPPALVTCWCAIDRATTENGCLWMLPGSHRHGYIDQQAWAEHERRAAAGSMPEQRPVELHPGDCSFHHGLILHASGENTSGARRRGYATHYASARCRYTGPAEKNGARLVRGRSYPGCI